MQAGTAPPGLDQFHVVGLDGGGERHDVGVAHVGRVMAHEGTDTVGLQALQHR